MRSFRSFFLGNMAISSFLTLVALQTPVKAEMGAEMRPPLATSEAQQKEHEAPELTLMKNPKAGCYLCHRDNEKFIGPTFAEIKDRYSSSSKENPALIDYLADRIIKGGNGAWGPTPMNSHPELTKIEAKQMVKYILGLKPELKSSKEKRRNK